MANPTPENAIALKIDQLRNSDSHWIEIDLSEQHLFAWKGQTQAFSAVISTGKANTPTHPGIYAVQRKYARDRMTGADYDVPNVPNVIYFDRGYARKKTCSTLQWLVLKDTLNAICEAVSFRTSASRFAYG